MDDHIKMHQVFSDAFNFDPAVETEEATYPVEEPETIDEEIYVELPF
jgi:hypothetical protein